MLRAAGAAFAGMFRQRSVLNSPALENLQPTETIPWSATPSGLPKPQPRP
jgi:hypothetical protein